MKRKSMIESEESNEEGSYMSAKEVTPQMREAMEEEQRERERAKRIQEWGLIYRAAAEEKELAEDDGVSVSSKRPEKVEMITTGEDSEWSKTIDKLVQERFMAIRVILAEAFEAGFKAAERKQQGDQLEYVEALYMYEESIKKTLRKRAIQMYVQPQGKIRRMDTLVEG